MRDESAADGAGASCYQYILISEHSDYGCFLSIINLWTQREGSAQVDWIAYSSE